MPIHDFEVVSVGAKEQGSFPPDKFEAVARHAFDKQTLFQVTAVALLDELSRRRRGELTVEDFEFFEFEIDIVHNRPFSVNAHDTTTDQWASIAELEDGTVHFSLVEA